MKKSLKTSKNRLSGRFKSPKLSPVIIEDFFKNLSLTKSDWNNKTGPSKKPELLSCTKFRGKSAKRVFINEDFTRFVTIDNEGHVHDLKVINVELNGSIDKENNGNVSNGYKA